jgi:uncharacterized OsmC-like protein
VSGAIREALERATAYLRANPAEALYTDSPATAVLDEGLRVTVSGPDEARLATDMPRSVGGDASSQSPGWYLRAAEASCVATLVAMRAAQVGVALERLSVTVDSQSDDRGILGIDPSVPAGPLSTRIRVAIEAPGIARQDLEDIVAWGVEHCPVTDAVRRAVPLTLEVAVAV